ncbi:MAG: macro domain-containing protein [Clostridia bacterium]|nr:macro domain-containing protein [Clostridia bacterium]
MSLVLIRQDITKMPVDAIVSASNRSLVPTGGVSLAIAKAGGEELQKAMQELGGVEIGQAKYTVGYNLPCTYVLYTASHEWLGGLVGEEDKLKSCYESVLNKAVELGCSSVAIPLIGTGGYGFPREQGIRIAVDVINDFLFIHDLLVYLVVYDKEASLESKRLFKNVLEYVDDNYTERYAYRNRRSRADLSSAMRQVEPVRKFIEERGTEIDDYWDEVDDYDGEQEEVLKSCSVCDAPLESISLESMLDNADESFANMLIKLIDAKGMSDVECYKKAGASRQTWHKIMTDKNHRPSKITVIMFALALELTLVETNKLLGSVGYTLSSALKFDIVIEYFIISGIYDPFIINETLYKLDLTLLGGV